MDQSYEEKLQYVDRLLEPVRDAFLKSENPEALQHRLMVVLENSVRFRDSFLQSEEADRQAALRKESPFIERAIQLVEQRYSDSEFGVEEFCRSIGMSRSLAGKRLRTELGVSVGLFIRGYRLRVAREMLLHDDYTRNITQIAYNAGFNDPKYFTRCFTKEFGFSPSEFVGQIDS